MENRMMDHEGGPEKNTDAQGIDCTVYLNGEWKRTKSYPVVEIPLTIYVNKRELVTILCTPHKLNCLVAGFLYSEGMIAGVDEITMMRVCAEENMAEILLNRSEVTLPEHRTLTSGCGGGVSLDMDLQHLPRLESTQRIAPSQAFALMKQLLQVGELSKTYGGLHTSALSDTERLLVVAEDVGRHNTLDKIQGECLLMDIPTKDKLLLSTGRISSEMLIKAAKMGVPIVISRNSPTDRAIKLAQESGITVIGYVRNNRLVVYTHPWRVQSFGNNSNA